jgi:hypothetical protein
MVVVVVVVNGDGLEEISFRGFFFWFDLVVFVCLLVCWIWVSLLGVGRGFVLFVCFSSISSLSFSRSFQCFLTTCTTSSSASV